MARNLVLLVVFLFSSSAIASPPSYNATSLKSIRNYLKTINKPAVKTIKSPNGDIIDCVVFHLQPAFDHPWLQGNKTMMERPQIPEELLRDNLNDTLQGFSQVWRMSGESCPENTIPIRRTTEEEVLRAGSVEAFMGRTQDGEIDAAEYATGYVDGQFYGAQAKINIWNPYVVARERSTAQIWIKAGDDKDLNVIEAGYEVRHHTKGPRFFIHATKDNYATGCHNLCGHGFVQVSQKIALGAEIQPVSTYGGTQKEIKITVQKSLSDGKWWLKYNDEVCGYWEKWLFTRLNREPAQRLEFGGQVNYHSTGTKTQMGSGQFPWEDFTKAAYVGQIYGMDMGHKFETVHLTPRYTNSKCYYTTIHQRPYETALFYGGPSCKP